MQAAHLRAMEAAMTYLHRHAGYTRVHNPLTGVKDLQRLPGLAAIAYQHETSRCERSRSGAQAALRQCRGNRFDRRSG